MNISKPLVSVIMPAYKVERYIAESIESVLNQTFTNFELIIIEDCSEDRTLEIIKSYKDGRIRLVCNEKNMDYIYGLNLGLKMAQGDFVARIDSDDWMDAYRLEKQVEFLNKHPDITVLGSHINVVNQDGEILFKLEYPVGWFNCIAWTYIDIHNPVAHPAVMFRKKEVQKIGGYRIEKSFSEDLDLWFRLMQKGYKFDNIDEPLTWYRKYKNQSSDKKTARGALQKKNGLDIVSELLSNIVGYSVIPEQCECYFYYSSDRYPFRSMKDIVKTINLRRDIINSLIKDNSLAKWQRDCLIKRNNMRISQLKKEFVKYPIKKLSAIL